MKNFHGLTRGKSPDFFAFILLSFLPFASLSAQRMSGERGAQQTIPQKSDQSFFAAPTCSDFNAKLVQLRKKVREAKEESYGDIFGDGSLPWPFRFEGHHIERGRDLHVRVRLRPTETRDIWSFEVSLNSVCDNAVLARGKSLIDMRGFDANQRLSEQPDYVQRAPLQVISIAMISFSNALPQDFVIQFAELVREKRAQKQIRVYRNRADISSGHMEDAFVILPLIGK